MLMYSTGMYGRNLGDSRELRATNGLLMFLNDMFSITARPVSNTGNIFNVAIVGQNFDPVELTDQQKFTNFFHEKTGRLDIAFGDFKSLAYWK